MAMAKYVLDMPTKLGYFLELTARANSTSEIIEAVQRYLSSWSRERIANVQKIDAGWAPFDMDQRPTQINGTLDVRCIRDAIHCHCMALREAGVALTLELVELDEFFYSASKIIEGFEEHGRSTPDTHTRPTPTHRNAFVNW